MGDQFDRGVLQRLIRDPGTWCVFTVQGDDSSFLLEACLRMRWEWKKAPHVTAMQSAAAVARFQRSLSQAVKQFLEDQPLIHAHHRLPLTLENIVPELNIEARDEQQALASLSIPDLLERMHERIALRTPLEDTDAMPAKPGAQDAFTTFACARLCNLWDEETLFESRVVIARLVAAISGMEDYEIDPSHWRRRMPR